ncbi:MAG: carboxymuconolactone decarboxylase family protein [Betaproteobacteria bacterium]|nr:carboxymuconolactone decarboxylase family protein [Betaproteobacteria bacterium]MBU6513633.1 carboxymuconolactone decarboxylase family protein [Betaproteobacteria bacterium]MDE1956509.1 carboxymuconolactone decarboxylase family protein [Betaproteobacteria bacterium]MDE2153284.1 carboxymuconolactone decarboxylase family protein [Betaproteobacteria bacterium]MDE2480405.1 carboxymuconolactone decarboxylase family protein [Betaproteobacteria bacterium]
MPRIPYLPADLADPAELVAAIRRRRGGDLLKLDRMLLYSPEFAAGWNALLGAVRTRLRLDPRLRELAICAVARLNDAAYEFEQHAPEFLAAGGTQQQLDALDDVDAASRDEARFDARERAVLGLTRGMTRDVRPAQPEFAAAAALFPRQELVELVGVVASYNMVSRFLVALGVHSELDALDELGETDETAAAGQAG